MAERLVWRCDLCGSTLPGPGLELATAECRCGVGKGNWRVARARTYEFRTVADFGELDDEQLAACLLDFSIWLGIRAAAGRIPGVAVKDPEVFRWIDDGRHDVTASFLDESGVEVARVQSTAAEVWPEELGGEA